MDRSPNISGSSFGSWLRFAVGEHHATLLFQVVCNVMHCHFIDSRFWIANGAIGPAGQYNKYNISII
jgi:hypothetical protein